MKPVPFKEQTAEVAKHQDEYNTLPAWIEDGDMGQVISSWSLSFKERLQVLFLGRVWLSVCAFGRPVSPVKMWTLSPFKNKESK